MKNDKTVKLTAVMGVIMLIATLFLPFIGMYVNSRETIGITLIGAIDHASLLQVLLIILAIAAPTYLILETFKDKVPAKVFVIPSIYASLLPLALIILFNFLLPKEGLEALLVRLKLGYYVYFVAAVISAIANIPKTESAKSKALLIGAVLLLIVSFTITFLIADTGRSFMGIGLSNKAYTMLTILGAHNPDKYSTVIPIMKVVALVEIITIVLMGLSAVQSLSSSEALRKVILPSKIISIVLAIAGIAGMVLLLGMIAGDEDKFVGGPAQSVFLIIAIGEFIIAFRKVES